MPETDAKNRRLSSPPSKTAQATTQTKLGAIVEAPAPTVLPQDAQAGPTSILSRNGQRASENHGHEEVNLEEIPEGSSLTRIQGITPTLMKIESCRN